jgi:hypothetical protein
MKSNIKLLKILVDEEWENSSSSMSVLLASQHGVMKQKS